MQLYCGYIVAMHRGCADLRTKSCDKLEIEILSIHMVAAWWPHECCTTPAWGLPMVCMWDHRFRWNSHPTHNNLTLASHHTYKGHMASLQAAGENMGNSQPEWGGCHMAAACVRQLSCGFGSPGGYHVAHGRPMCGLCEEPAEDRC